MTEIK